MDKQAYTVAEFCELQGISRALFYKLRANKRGPQTYKIGRKTLVSAEAAKEWQRQMEKDSH